MYDVDDASKHVDKNIYRVGDAKSCFCVFLVTSDVGDLYSMLVMTYIGDL